MTATMERAMNILQAMPEPEVERFITMFIRYEPTVSLQDADFAEYEKHMSQTQQWAKDHDLSPDDITKAIKAVRQKKRQQA